MNRGGAVNSRMAPATWPGSNRVQNSLALLAEANPFEVRGRQLRGLLDETGKADPALHGSDSARISPHEPIVRGEKIAIDFRRELLARLGQCGDLVEREPDLAELRRSLLIAHLSNHQIEILQNDDLFEAGGHRAAAISRTPRKSE